MSQAFTASSILRTHIRQHSGERPFKCKHCGKAFASHAAHDSHVRRTHAKDKPFSCDVCATTFQDAQELKYHMKTHKSKKILNYPNKNNNNIINICWIHVAIINEICRLWPNLIKYSISARRATTFGQHCCSSWRRKHAFLHQRFFTETAGRQFLFSRDDQHHLRVQTLELTLHRI